MAAPGQKGHSTWSSDPWKQGGAAMGTQMAIDPQTGIRYANAGNPQPNSNGPACLGSNLYSNSPIALNISGAKPNSSGIASSSHTTRMTRIW